MQKKHRNIFFLFGLAAIVIMVLTFQVSFAEMWRHVERAGVWLWAILLLWMGLYFLNTLTWHVIIRGSGPQPVPLSKLYKVTVSGFALNYATPAGLMGGEPYKIMELTPYIGRERATSSVLLFAMMHIFAHFWFWLTAVVLFVVCVPMDWLMAWTMLFVTLFSLAGVYLFSHGYRHGMVRGAVRLAGRIPGCRRRVERFARSHSDELTNIDRQIAMLQGQNKHSFYGSFFLEYVGRILQSVEILIMLRIVGIAGSWPLLMAYSVMILAFTSLFANLLFFLPLQLGGREGGFAMSTVKMRMCGPLGLLTVKEAMTIAVFISIICRLRELVWTCLGMLLIKIGNKERANNNH